MDPERWREVEALYEAALGLDARQRAAFLEERCGGDGSLRSEVESLLLHDENVGSFLEKPALQLLSGVHGPAGGKSFVAVPQDAELSTEGQLINGYRVLKRLGAGGMGLVYEAVDVKLDRHVALKFLPPELDFDDAARTALVNEARAASALDHPNIATIHGLEETPNGQRFIVMACYEGQTLSQRIREGPLQLQEVTATALQIAEGLAEAHSHHIVHRDIKPSNIFLTRQGLVKILDFGIARVIHSASSTRSLASPGTTAYMSPEQAQAKPLDARTDLWSLGATIYEMTTGRRAFEAGDVPATLFAIVNQAPEALGDDVPRSLQKVIYRALAKKPEDRYANASEMLSDLREASAMATDGRAAGAASANIEVYRARAAGPHQPRARLLLLRWVLPLAFAVALLTGVPTVHRTRPGTGNHEKYLKACALLERYDDPGNVDQAISLLDEVVAADLNFALAYANLGNAYRLRTVVTGDRKWLDPAFSNASRAAQLNESLPAVHVVMGRIQRALGDRDLALQEFQRARKLEPRNADALLGIAGVYEDTGRIKDAEREYRDAAAMRPDFWEGWNTLGRFLKRQGRQEDAAAQFRRVIELNPSTSLGYVNLYAVLVDLRKFDEAEATLRTALQRARTSYLVHMNLGQFYIMKGQFQEALQETRQALGLNNKAPQAWINLAVIHRRLKEDKKAVDAYKSVLPILEQQVKIAPQNVTQQALLAEIYAYTGEPEKARHRIETSLALERENASVLLSCANAYAAIGDSDLAVKKANQAVSKGLTRAQLDADPETWRFKNHSGFKPPSK